MATTKAKKSTSKPAATKAPAKKSTTKVTTVSASSPAASGALNMKMLAIVIAETIGTFVLTMVALLALQGLVPLYVGLTLVVLVLAIGAVSGAHVNPAVTFGLWAARKLKPVMLPVYWLAQFLGAMLAVLLLSAVAGGTMNLNFNHFGDFSWAIMFAELIGSAVFLLGLTLVIDRTDLKSTGKAVGVGLSLLVGILVSSSLFTSIQSGVDQTQISFTTDEATGKQVLTNVPHELRVDGATLNPAVALAATEKTDSELQGNGVADGEVEYSRLSWEVILGTLVGAALGGNLALLLGRFKQD